MSSGFADGYAAMLILLSTTETKMFDQILVIRGFSALMLLVLLPVCGCTGEVERRWSEEVQVTDGKTIVVDRYVKFRESNSISGDAYSSTDLKSTLTFKTKSPNLPSWDAPLVPILLFEDSKTSEWVIVATTSNCDVWSENGSPIPPYWEYRLKGGKWELGKLSEASIGRATNLFFDYEPVSPPRLVNKEFKEGLINRTPYATEYLRIGAEQTTNCG